MVAHHVRDAPILRRHHTKIKVVHTKVVSHVKIIMRRDGGPCQENTYELSVNNQVDKMHLYKINNYLQN